MSSPCASERMSAAVCRLEVAPQAVEALHDLEYASITDLRLRLVGFQDSDAFAPPSQRSDAAQELTEGAR